MSTDFTGADPTGADLTGADLTGADLTGADPTGADLTGADLTGTDLTGTDLTGTDLTGADFDAVFAAFAASPTSTTVFRWEALQHYEVAADEPSLVAFREGTPRPERSVRTSPWLARMATSTIAGKAWHRVRHVVKPLSEYLRWELLAYVESQSVGEQITVHTAPDTLPGPDFWLFDGEPADQRAILMHYDPAGTPRRYELLEHDDPRLPGLRKVRDQVSAAAVPLNQFLAAREVGVHAA